LQEWIMPQYDTPLIWRLQKKLAGSGALGDLGAHIIDLGRHLIGETESVSALTRTFIEHRARLDGKGTGKVDVADAVVSVGDVEHGNRCAVIWDAIVESAQSGKRIKCKY